MLPSARIISFVKGYEKCWRPVKARPGWFEAYMPTPDDKPTIGWGSTGKDIRMGMSPWSQSQCDARFNLQAGEFAAEVWTALKGAPTTQAQFDALWSLAYNIGIPNFKTSSVLTNHRAGHYATAALAFVLWNKQRGKDGILRVLNGLTKRRKAEAAIYRGE